jgi:predicted GNAT superfamily acetyltransferase
MKDVDLRIRRAERLQDYLACVELQKQVWGFVEMEDIAAPPILLIANRFGGNVLVAQEESGRVIGFSFAMPVWMRDRRLFWWSHMTAVIEEYRNRDVGLRLKLQQRQEALAGQIDLIAWTFDPMQSINAHFNVHKLGVTIREYEENVYGLTSSPLHQGLPTDRFVAAWYLNSDRVKQRTDASTPSIILRDLDRIQRINRDAGEPNLHLQDSPLALEIPNDVNALKLSDLDKARQWQARLRVACQHYFHAGYTVTDFIVVDQPSPQALYILEK